MVAMHLPSVHLVILLVVTCSIGISQVVVRYRRPRMEMRRRAPMMERPFATELERRVLPSGQVLVVVPFEDTYLRNGRRMARVRPYRCVRRFIARGANRVVYRAGLCPPVVHYRTGTGTSSIAPTQAPPSSTTEGAVTEAPTTVTPRVSVPTTSAPTTTEAPTAEPTASTTETAVQTSTTSASTSTPPPEATTEDGGGETTVDGGQGTSTNQSTATTPTTNSTDTTTTATSTNGTTATVESGSDSSTSEYEDSAGTTAAAAAG